MPAQVVLLEWNTEWNPIRMPLTAGFLSSAPLLGFTRAVSDRVTEHGSVRSDRVTEPRSKEYKCLSFLVESRVESYKERSKAGLVRSTINYKGRGKIRGDIRN